MKIAKKLAATLVATAMATALYGPVFADLFDQQPSEKPAANRAAEAPCQPLTWAAANKLPSWVKPSDVACMSVSTEDLEASRQARALLLQAAGQAQDQAGTLSNSATETQYDDGLAAYAEGRYSDAIVHFRAAMPSVSPIEFQH
ncbi:MAG TPA: hypothetical protein VMU41_07135 [Candidatus Binataceae bacterium]|nr:hypothetical protein [Candidatus Binataceae bacterium]